MYLYLVQIRYLIKGSYPRCLRTRVNLKGIQLPCTSGDRVCSHFPRWRHLPGPAPIWAGSLCCEGIINLLPGTIGGRVPFTASCLLKARVAPSIRLRFPFSLTKVEHTYSTGRHCRHTAWMLHVQMPRSGQRTFPALRRLPLLLPYQFAPSRPPPEVATGLTSTVLG